MKTKKRLDKGLMAMGEMAFWKEFEDLTQKEQRYVIVDDGQVIVLNGKLKQKPKKIKV